MITERIDNIARIPADFLMPNPPAPKSIKIELTSQCNYRCSYCGLTTRNGTPTSVMEWDLFLKVAREAKEAGVQEVGLFYIGEPFLAPTILKEAILYCKKVLDFPYVFVTSNASRAYFDNVKVCMDYGLDSLKWSCNVHDAETFSLMMRVKPEAFESAKANIRAAYHVRELYRYKTKLYASSIMFDELQPERMKPFLDEFVLPYVDEHYWLPLLNHGYVFEDGETGPGNTGRYSNPVAPLPCWAAFTIAHVMVDGRLTACCFDSKGDWVVGNIAENPFMDVWNGDKFTSLRKSHLTGNVKGTQCERCVLQGIQ